MSDSVSKIQRIVPSGKIYRQKFDAEVQLVKAWKEVKQPTDEPQDMPMMGQRKSDNIPVVHESRKIYGGGILNERQKNWAYAFPNESDVENPVLHKHFVDFMHEKQRQKDESLPSKEVRGLPDVIIPAKVGSDVVKRITDSRKQRHESALEDMKQELAVLNSKLEPEIVEHSQNLITLLAQNDEKKSLIISKLKSEEELHTMTIGQVNELWEAIVAVSVQSRQWIAELDEKLSLIEERRLKEIREIFARYACDFEKIAHLSAAEQHTMLDQESQRVNETLLTNRRVYADLYARLMMADIEHEKQLHVYWKKRIEEWRKLNISSAITNFRNFMSESSIKDPAGARTVISNLIQAQTTFVDQRMILMNVIRNTKPPALTKAFVHNWYQQVLDLTKRIDETNQDHFKQLHQQYERTCQSCLDKAESIKADLVKRSVCTEKSANRLLAEQCLPLIGELQRSFEIKMEQVDKSIEFQYKTVCFRLKQFFKYCQGAAHLWDIHEVGLAKQERALQEKLDESRRKYDRLNQDREAMLDIQMDRMRQEKSEATLKEALKKVHDMIAKMKAGTEAFGREQKVIIQAYPAMVSEECQQYEMAVCDYFNLRRAQTNSTSQSTDKSSSNQNSTISVTPQQTSHPEQLTNDKIEQETFVTQVQVNENIDDGLDINISVNITAPLSEQATPQSKVVDKICTSQGTFFLIVEGATKSSDISADSRLLLSSREDSNLPIDDFVLPEPLPDYIQQTEITDDFLNELKKMLRINMIDHLETWLLDSTQKAADVVFTKIDELNNALDLSFHLHEPRALRAEMDVHNVRAAELTLHSERVSRHCKGCTEALVNLRDQFNKLSEDVGRLIYKYREDIQGMESLYIKVNKPSIMETMTARLLREQEKCMNVVRAMIREFHNNLNRTLQTLRESNSRFITSFRLFSEGGNFCPEEADEYRKRLQKVNKKIDQMEGVILCDLEAMEAKKFDETSKISQEFEDRFKSQMVDLKFIEVVTRRLTNAQVKIKAEVADSNMQSQIINRTLADLERKIDACAHPNLDKEPVTPSQLCESMELLYGIVLQRVSNLNCLRETNRALHNQVSFRISSPSEGGKSAYYVSDNGSQISRAGRPSNEDLTVNVIRDILKSQKNKFSTEVESEVTPVVSGREPSGRRSRASKATDSDHSRARSRRLLSPLRSTAARPEDNKNNVSSATVIIPGRGRRQGKIDKKFFVFGEEPEENETAYLLGRIKHLLRETNISLLFDGEAYYKQKGSRPVTRPQLLQDTFDLFCEAIVEKLLSYQTQAQDYHNQCLTEFRDQLDRCEEIVALIPPLIVNEYLLNAKSQLEQDKINSDNILKEKLLELEKIRAQHETNLKPSLGHPQQEAVLTRLCDQEESRCVEMKECIINHTRHQKEMVAQHASQFLKELSRKAESLLLLFDGLVTIDDVQRSNTQAVRHSTVELLRRRQAGKPLEDDPDKEKIARGKMTWPGLPRADILPVMEERVSSAKQNKKLQKVDNDEMGRVTTSKTTMGHQATIESRNKAYKEYKGIIASILADIDENSNKHRQDLVRWTQCWNTSVNKIKRLF